MKIKNTNFVEEVVERALEEANIPINQEEVRQFAEDCMSAVASMHLDPLYNRREEKWVIFNGMEFVIRGDSFFDIGASSKPYVNIVMFTEDGRTFPKWHSLKGEVDACLYNLRLKTHLYSYEELSVMGLLSRIFGAYQYSYLKEKGRKELTDGLKKRRAERAVAKSEVQEGNYEVDDDILKQYLKSRCFPNEKALAILYKDYGLCIVAKIHVRSEGKRTEVYNWLVDELCVLVYVGKEYIIYVKANSYLYSLRIYIQRAPQQFINSLVNSKVLSEQDRSVLNRYLAFRGL